MHQCCVFGCRNEGVHLFPRDKKLRKQWEIQTRRKNFRATKNSKFCSAHFKPEDYCKEGFYSGLQNTRRILMKGVVPSLFAWSKKEDPVAEQRRKRAEYRNAKRKLFSVNEDYQQETCNATEDINYCVGEIEVTSECVVSNSENSINCPSFCDIGTQKHFQFYTVESFRDNDKMISFYTGLESFDKFMFVFSTLCPEAYSLKYRRSQVLHISAEDQFLLTLMKLKRNKEDFELGTFFNISLSTVSNIFITWINFMYQMWEMLDVWPSRELINFYMPEGFKENYPSTRVIIDCTEIPIQRPTNPAAQQAVWSSYKNRCTLKFEVGSTPNGLLSHCSEAYGGSTSDRQIVERSSLLHKCERGDSVMADCGFNVQDIFAPKGVTINIPTFFKGRNQLPGVTVLKDRKLSSKCIHIERMIGLTKTYRILQVPLNISYVTLMSKLYFVCQMLCNFREGIVSQNA